MCGAHIITKKALSVACRSFSRDQKWKYCLYWTTRELVVVNKKESTFSQTAKINSNMEQTSKFFKQGIHHWVMTSTLSIPFWHKQWGFLPQSTFWDEVSTHPYLKFKSRYEDSTFDTRGITLWASTFVNYQSLNHSQLHKTIKKKHNEHTHAPLFNKDTNSTSMTKNPLLLTRSKQIGRLQDYKTCRRNVTRR